MLELYHQIIDTPADDSELEKTVTGDGDPIQLHELVYDIDNPQTEFDALSDLGSNAEAEISREQLLAQAEYDASGALHTVDMF